MDPEHRDNHTTHAMSERSPQPDHGRGMDHGSGIDHGGHDRHAGHSVTMSGIASG